MLGLSETLFSVPLNGVELSVLVRVDEDGETDRNENQMERGVSISGELEQQ